MPFDKGDLLAGAGYGTGDDIWDVGPQSNANNSTSSDSYQSYVLSDMNTRVQWDQHPGDNVQGRVVGWATVSPGSDQIDIRIRNLSDRETAVEQTGITGSTQTVTIGPADYTPTTTASPIQLGPEFRNGDNSTSVTVNGLTFAIGVKIR